MDSGAVVRSEARYFLILCAPQREWDVRVIRYNYWRAFVREVKDSIEESDDLPLILNADPDVLGPRKFDSL